MIGKKLKRTLSRLGWLYAISVGSLLVLLVFDEFIQDKSLKSQVDGTHLYAINQEQRLSSEVVHAAHLLVQPGDGNRAPRRRGLDEALLQWRERRLTLDRLLHPRFSSAQSAKDLYTGLEGLMPIRSQIDYLAQTILLRMGDKAPDLFTANEAAQQLAQEQSRYARDIAAEVKRFEGAWAREHEDLERLDGLVHLLIVLIIGVQALLAFFPTLRRLRESIDGLEEAEINIQQQNDRLVEQNGNLQGRENQIADYAVRLERLNEQYQLSSRRFEDLFDGLPVACFGFDREGRVYEWNQACESLFGFAASEVLEKRYYQLLFEDTRLRSVSKRHLARLFAGLLVKQFEWEFGIGNLSKNILSTAIPLYNNDGSIRMGMIASFDISERKAAEAALRESEQRYREVAGQLERLNAQLGSLARTDGLTGLYNHRSFQQKINDEFHIAKEGKSALSIVILDVDHFKEYNDSFGHQAGDQVLRQLADLLNVASRNTDFVARYGGEEFVVVLPGAGAQRAFDVAERMRQSIQQATWPHRPVTASFGVATLQSDIHQAEQLLRGADEALYQAKASGRNRTVANGSGDNAAAA